MVIPHVTINVSGLANYLNVVPADLAGTGNGPVRWCFDYRWGPIYREFSQLRFDKYSKGGGDWKPLSDATKARRRKGKGPRKFAILVDTATMKNALTYAFGGKPGQLQKDIPYGIKVGYGGPGRYRKGGQTVASIAEVHQTGDGVPQRKIIVDPDPPTVERMAKALQEAVINTLKKK
jgi:hypothetical protein